MTNKLIKVSQPVILVIIMGLIFNQFLSYKTQIHNLDSIKNYSDTEWYVGRSEIPISDFAFWTANRPFVLPLLYKVLDFNTQTYKTKEAKKTVARFQFNFAIISWTILAFAMAINFRNPWLMPIAFGAVLFLSLSMEISLWDRLMLSESIASSLYALYLAMLFIGIKLWHNMSRRLNGLYIIFLVLLIIVQTLYAFSRDTNAYFVLLLFPFLLAGLIFRGVRRHPGLVFYLIFTCSTLITFLLQNYTVEVGKRWFTPLQHSYVEYIFSDPDAIAYFENRGMPINDRLLSLSNLPYEEYSVALRTEPYAEDFITWFSEEGKRHYSIYLLTHPKRWLFLLDNYQPMFNPDTSGYRSVFIKYPPKELVTLLERLDFNIPGYAYAFMWFGLLILSRCSILERKEPMWIMIAFLLISMPPLMLLIIYGDTIEIHRHAQQIGIQLRITILIMLLLLIDLSSTFLSSRLGLLANRMMLL